MRAIVSATLGFAAGLGVAAFFALFELPFTKHAPIIDRKSFEHGAVLGINEGIKIYKRRLLGEEFPDPVGVIMSNVYAASPFIKSPTTK